MCQSLCDVHAKPLLAFMVINKIVGISRKPRKADKSAPTGIPFFLLNPIQANSDTFCSIVSYSLGNEKCYASIFNKLPGVTTAYALPSCCTTCLRSEGVIVHAITYTFKY